MPDLVGQGDFQVDLGERLHDPNDLGRRPERMGEWCFGLGKPAQTRRRAWPPVHAPGEGAGLEEFAAKFKHGGVGGEGGELERACCAKVARPLTSDAQLRHAVDFLGRDVIHVDFRVEGNLGCAAVVIVRRGRGQ